MAYYLVNGVRVETAEEVMEMDKNMIVACSKHHMKLNTADQSICLYTSDFSDYPSETYIYNYITLYGTEIFNIKDEKVCRYLNN